MVGDNLHRFHRFHCGLFGNMSSEFMSSSCFHTSRVPSRIIISHDAHLYPFHVSACKNLHTYRSHGATRHIQTETKMSQKSGASTWWYVVNRAAARLPRLARVSKFLGRLSARWMSKSRAQLRHGHRNIVGERNSS